MLRIIKKIFSVSTTMVQHDEDFCANSQQKTEIDSEEIKFDMCIVPLTSTTQVYKSFYAFKKF